MSELDLIRSFNEFNQLLRELKSKQVSKNDLMYVQKLDVPEDNYYFPCFPYKNDFFYLGLVEVVLKTEEHTDRNQLNKNYYLIFQAPNTLFKFHKNMEILGFTVFFKNSILDIYRPSIEEFVFFNYSKTTFLSIDKSQFETLYKEFELLYAEYSYINKDIQIPSIALVNLMLKINIFFKENIKYEHPSTSYNVTYRFFIDLVEKRIYDYKTVDDFANIIGISSNYLSKIVKTVSGKNALEIINSKVLKEIKSLLAFSTEDITSIAFKLNFSNQANFSKFFKKHMNMSPTEYRKKNPFRNSKLKL